MRLFATILCWVFERLPSLRRLPSVYEVRTESDLRQFVVFIWDECGPLEVLKADGLPLIGAKHGNEPYLSAKAKQNSTGCWSVTFRYGVKKADPVQKTDEDAWVRYPKREEQSA